MARHNRDGRGEDQQGRTYQVSYQPDWLKQVKVTRDLEHGRQSTRTLFRNPAPGEQAPGSRVRTRISSSDPALDFTIEVDDPRGVIRRVIVETHTPGVPEPDASVSFSIETHGPRPQGSRRRDQKT